MRLNFTANTFIFGRKNRENATRTFFNLQSENLQNTPGLYGKQLRLCTQNL